METAARLGLACAWLCASVATTLANKHVASGVAGPLVLTLVQLVFAGIVSAFVVSVCVQDRKRFVDGWSVVWICTMTPLFLVSIVVNLIALEKVPITTWLVFRNIEPAIVAVLEANVPSLRRQCTGLSVGALAGLVCGSLLAQKWSTARGVSSGFAWCIVALMLGACARMWQAWLFDHTNVQRHVLVLYNNFFGSVLLLAYLMAFEGHSLAALAAPECPREWMLISCVPATFLSFGNVLLQDSFAASQMAVLSCIAKILLIIISVITLHETLDMIRLFGIALAITSCLVYTLNRPPKTSVPTYAVIDSDEPSVLRPYTPRRLRAANALSLIHI